MESYFPALNLKAKLIVLMVALLGLTLGAELWVSLGTQEAIVATTQEKVKDLARAIQISVQELTSVGNIDRDRLRDYVASLHTRGIEVSIASSQALILNSSNPHLIGAALHPKQAEWLTFAGKRILALRDPSTRHCMWRKPLNRRRNANFCRLTQHSHRIWRK